MRRRMPGLAGWLAITTSLLVTAAVFAVSVAGVRSLRDLADAEALIRVELAVAAAREALRQNADDLFTATRVLSERPTLLRLLGSSNPAALPPYLKRYCEGAALDACGAVGNGKLVAEVGDGVDWPKVLASAGEQAQRYLVTGALAETSLMGAQAVVADRDGFTVYALRRMDSAFADKLSNRVGEEIRIEDFASFRPGEGLLGVLNSDALAKTEAVTARINALDAYAASLPVAAASGETIALLQAVLPVSDVMGPVARMEQRILFIAIVVALLATMSGVLIGRYWIDGVRRLTDAARRIGSGDLTASIPEERGAEIGVLASTMEEMRRNLVELTDEIRLREAQAQAVLGGIVEGVFAVDQKRRVRFLNPKAEKLLNVTAADAFGRFCGDVLNPATDADGRRPCEYACPIVKARDVGAAEAVEQIGGAAGRARRVVVASAAASDGIQVQVLRDETELEAVRRTRDTVLANISHEFRTPLAAQLASIELLRDGLGAMPLSAQRHLVASLERGVQRLTWLIDNLLESVRIESGQLSIRRHDVMLGDVVGAARDLIEPLILQRGQRLELESLDNLPAIRGDRQRLVQVVVNLLANASKFGPPNSVIRIGGRFMNGAGIDLWVDDEGPGPANPDDVKLFEQFRRSGGEDPEESGLGLGLFIVRSIVERHGGRVSLARTAESRTRAQVHLPMDGTP
jgi:signal transduction histidine kinase/HAMP domain-containing protein